MSVDEHTKAASTTSAMIEPYKHLHIIPNPDGSITRFLQNTTISPTSYPSNTAPVFLKDLTINPSNNTWARLYIPRHALSSSSKLPLIICFQGGGFILLNSNSTPYHNFCVDFASKINVVIVSVNYRLAPEHRLPAAYDDAVEALMWASSNAYLSRYVDFSNCFLKGSSAGANIAYNAGLRVASGAVGELYPLKIKGMILHQPFFGGSKRTESELKLVNDNIFPLCVNDLMWELSLPKGVGRDHEYCNPRVEEGSEVLEKMRKMGWRVMVVGCEGDPLFDRQVEFAKMMEEKGVSVTRLFSKGGCHGDEIFEPSKAILKNFIYHL